MFIICTYTFNSYAILPVPDVSSKIVLGQLNRAAGSNFKEKHIRASMDLSDCALTRVGHQLAAHPKLKVGPQNSGTTILPNLLFVDFRILNL